MTYTLCFRRYAPFDSFGFGFHGDGRTEPDITASARTTAIIEFDVSGGVANIAGESGASYHTLFPDYQKTGLTSVTLSHLRSDAGTLTFTAHSAGALPLIPGAPDIDTFVDLTATTTAAGLRVFGRVRGDTFPNASVFVFKTADAAGPPNAIWHYETTGGRNTGPMTRLPGAHAGTSLGGFNVVL